ncbi:helix-turn-helix domain-containing protein [Streptomyces sp. NPDC057540]|uniref:helix-turn-helix domain-containing protein n=1 Tax=Streptomyces sp. NPDC057540 TaxID=3346160 RepID=UPI00369E98CD
MTTTAAEDADAFDKRRATVAQLRADGLSLREIATKLDITKDTVYRDLQALSRDTATPCDQPCCSTVAPSILAVALPTATPESDTATPSRDTATHPAPAVTLPLTARFVADLATLTRNNVSPEAAVRHAVALVARAYRQAWEAGTYPRDVNPVLARYQFAPHTPPVPEPPATDTTVQG